MLDHFEKLCLDVVQTEEYKARDCLMRAASHFNEDDFERDQWGYALVQVGKARAHLEKLRTKLLAARTRRLQGGAS